MRGLDGSRGAQVTYMRWPPDKMYFEYVCDLTLSLSFPSPLYNGKVLWQKPYHQ